MSTETDSTPPPAYTPGPFKETRTRTFEIQGPIKFVVTEHTDASHVPPIEKPCGGCGGHATQPGMDRHDLLSALMQFAPQFAEILKISLKED